MSELSRALGANAAPQEFKAGDRIYKIHPISNKLLVEFENRNFGRACEELMVAKPFMTQEHYERKFDQLLEMKKDGDYALGDVTEEKFKKNPKLGILLAALIFGCSEDDALDLVKNYPSEVKGYIKLMQKESFPDPKAEIPGEGPPG